MSILRKRSALPFPLLPGLQLVQRVHIGLGTRHDDVRVGAVAAYLFARLLDPRSHFAERVGAAGDGFHEICVKPAAEIENNELLMTIFHIFILMYY